MSVFYRIRQQNPIIHCITNPVSANYQANGLLTIGASPIMSESIDEMEELVAKVSALSLNIGTLNATTFALMKKAGEIANQHHVPVVLDPVGAGFTTYRTEISKALLDAIDIQLIRCNLGEFAALANIDWQAKGVDAGSGNIDLVIKHAQQFANNHDCLLAITGQEDIVASKSALELISGGDERVTQITASGCLLSSITAAALSLKANPFADLIETLSLYKQAAATAAQYQPLLGSFYTEFSNQLFKLSQKEA